MWVKSLGTTQQHEGVHNCRDVLHNITAVSNQWQLEFVGKLGQANNEENIKFRMYILCDRPQNHIPMV